MLDVTGWKINMQFSFIQFSEVKSGDTFVLLSWDTAVFDVLCFVYDREKPDDMWMMKFNMVIRRYFNDYNNSQILSLSS